MKYTTTLILMFIIVLGCGSSGKHDDVASTSQSHCYGVFNSEASFNQQIRAEYEKDYVVAPCVVMLYWDWDAPYNTAELLNIWNTGAIPMLTLEPWLAENKQGVALNEISSGHQDGRLYELARVIREYGHPLFLRFAHEMNGNWYPWSGEKNGKNAKSYIEAYRHVHGILTTATHPNRQILWVWSINAENVPDTDWNKALSYFPGKDYADAVGIDGYNMTTIPPKKGFKWLNAIIAWSGDKIWGRFYTFGHIFGRQIEYVEKTLPELPIFITEVATSLHGSQKTEWIETFFETLKNDYPQIPLFVWFDTAKETDWRIGNDDASLNAFKDGLANWKTAGNKNSLLMMFGMVSRPND